MLARMSETEEADVTRYLRRWWFVSILAVWLALVLFAVGCSKSSVAASPTASAATSPAGTPSTASPSPLVVPAGCRPKGSKLQISTKGQHFSARCLAAPAGAPFTIALDNSVGIGPTHNLSIYTDSTASQSLFEGSQVATGQRVTYHVPQLPAGTYFFRCDIHPQTMVGVFVVR